VPTVEFALADGSALIRRLRSLGLVAWIPRHVTGQVVFAALLAWAPLLVFTAYDGTALGNKVHIPFLVDIIQYARFFIALPCAIAVGNYINPRLEGVLNSFLKGGFVTSHDRPRFDSAIRRAKTLASSLTVEFVILALVYAYAWLGLHRSSSAGLSSWTHARTGANVPQSPADWWFLCVSMPLLLFGWFLWLWRLGVWTYLLFRISRLGLRVLATHPDGAGGLNFVNVSMRRFAVLIFAISSILCASIGEEIVFNGARLKSYELELASFFLVCLAVTLGPLLVFTPTLIRSKLSFWARYGPLASRYMQEFDDKWIVRTGDSHQHLLGTPDIQSLADLRHSYAGISQMRTMLPSQTTVGILAAAYVLPSIPLLASIIPLRQVISEVYTLLLK
jgi:hypothetical protein